MCRAFGQLSVTEGFPDHCSMDWVSGKLGVSAIIPQSAAGYSILSKFHILCAYTAPAVCQLSAVGFLLSYKYETDTCSRCAMLCIIEAVEYFVCVRGMMFAALASVQMCKVILVCLLSWLKQQCNYLTTYGQLLLQVSWKCRLFYSHAHMWLTDMVNSSSLGCCCLAISFIL